MTFMPVDGKVAVGASHNAPVGVMIVEGPDGGMGWRSLDPDDRVTAPRFGKVYGREGDDAADAKYALSRKVIETALRSMLAEKQGAPGSARSKRAQAVKSRTLAVARNRRRRRAALAGAARQD